MAVLSWLWWLQGPQPRWCTGHLQDTEEPAHRGLQCSSVLWVGSAGALSRQCQQGTGHHRQGHACRCTACKV